MTEDQAKEYERVGVEILDRIDDLFDELLDEYGQFNAVCAFADYNRAIAIALQENPQVH